MSLEQQISIMQKTVNDFDNATLGILNQMEARLGQALTQPGRKEANRNKPPKTLQQMITDTEALISALSASKDNTGEVAKAA